MKKQHQQNNKNAQPELYVSIKDRWKKPPQSSLTFIDLFSGCGGITKGLIAAGLQPIAGFDCNKEAV